MVFSFARVSAALSLKVKDYFFQGGNRYLRVIDKRNTHRHVPVHPKLNEYLTEYMEAAGLTERKEALLFQAVNRKRELTGEVLNRQRALEMVARRARQAGVDAIVCCHTFRATGITAYLEGDGAIERAAYYAGHASIRTTQLYDRRQDIGSVEDITRIRLS